MVTLWANFSDNLQWVNMWLTIIVVVIALFLIGLIWYFAFKKDNVEKIASDEGDPTDPASPNYDTSTRSRTPKRSLEYCKSKGFKRGGKGMRQCREEYLYKV